MFCKYFSSLLLCLLCCTLPGTANAQTADCPYPIIFLHGWTGDQTSFADSYNDPVFTSLYGQLTSDHVFHAMLNAQTSTHIWGDDGIKGTNDDDALVVFDNEDNVLPAGCVYAINFDNSWNENTSNPIIYRNNGDAIGFTESDSNESAIVKQGYALGEMIKKVLAANPGKKKVILAGHSMGGLAIREYLQRGSGGTHPWWVNPSSAQGHQVARVLTTTTPHRGSNTLGNGVRDGDTPQRDGLPDYFSEAVRDLRYSWACGFLGLSDCPGAYLYGGEEDAGFGWWNEDVDCDGDESSIIEGINVSGGNTPWNGTYDNPSMPLPTDIHYTWLTSDIPVFFGDGVVAWDRQWLFNGNTPYPFDGVSGRLSDTVLTDVTHLASNDDIRKLIRGMDEGDYPFFAWEIEQELPYYVLPTFRPLNNAHGTASYDPDWLMFTVPANYTDDLAIDLQPSATVATELDFFAGNITDYTEINELSTYNAFYAEGINTQQRLLIPNAALQKGGVNYLRIIHSNVDYNDWQVPAEITLSAVAPLPLQWAGFELEELDEKTAILSWETRTEENVSHFVVQRSLDGRQFQSLGQVNAENKPTAAYQFIDDQATGQLWYYRIQSLDVDGSSSYSPILTLQRTAKTATLGTLFPNPAQDFINLPISLPPNTHLQWTITNVLGQTQSSGQTNSSLPDNLLKIPVKALSVSWHHLHLDTGLQQWTLPFFHSNP